MRHKKHSVTQIGLLIQQKSRLEKNIQSLIHNRKLLKAKIMKVKLLMLNQKWKQLITKVNAMNDPAFEL